MNKLLFEGLSDAAGFIAGTITGYWIGLLLGLNIFSEGYNGSAIGAIALVGLSGGLGVQLVRAWRCRGKTQGD